MDCPFKDPKLNRDEVIAVAALQTTTEEIAAYFDTSVDVIEEFYRDVVRQGMLKGKIQLRQLMLDAAKDSKDPRAIEFLARNFLSATGGDR